MNETIPGGIKQKRILLSLRINVLHFGSFVVASLDARKKEKKRLLMWDLSSHKLIIYFWAHSPGRRADDVK